MIMCYLACVCIYVCARVHNTLLYYELLVCAYACVYACVRLCVCAFTHVSVCACMCMCIHPCVCLRACVCVYVYAGACVWCVLLTGHTYIYSMYIFYKRCGIYVIGYYRTKK